jgi:triosephosphate isomerase (TIM)
MKYFVANWKMNMSIKDIITWLDKFSNIKFPKDLDRHIIICPSFPHLSLIKEVSKEIGFEIGTQDISVFEKGAHTGETGRFQIKELANYCIVGHSEREESLDTVVSKRDLCIRTGLTPIVCFVNQNDIRKLDTNGAILCWEDPKNISKDGVYRDKNPADIEKGLKKIKRLVSPNTTIIYGGSVNKENIKHLNKVKEIDGVLVGNASLDPNHFADIINSSL